MGAPQHVNHCVICPALQAGAVAGSGAIGIEVEAENSGNVRLKS